MALYIKESSYVIPCTFFLELINNLWLVVPQASYVVNAICSFTEGDCEFTSAAPEIISHNDLKLKIKTNSGEKIIDRTKLFGSVLNEE